MKKEKKEVSLLEYANKHNTVKSRRGHQMTFSYLYRLVRETEKGTATRELWFKYRFDGERDAILVTLN